MQKKTQQIAVKEKEDEVQMTILRFVVCSETLLNSSKKIQQSPECFVSYLPDWSWLSRFSLKIYRVCTSFLYYLVLVIDSIHTYTLTQILRFPLPITTRHKRPFFKSTSNITKNIHKGIEIKIKKNNNPPTSKEQLE